MPPLPTRAVLVTGGAGAIGSAIVHRFLNNGDFVIATDVSQESLDRLKSEVDGACRSRLIAVAADISSEEDCARLACAVLATTGTVEVLIHCAGFFPIVEFEGMSVAQWRQVIDINLTGPFLLTKAVLPLMKSKGWGRIINFGSGSMFDGVAGQTHYVAAKAGIVGFSRSLAREVGKYGITVNVITPGLTVSPSVLKHFPPAVLEAQRSGRAISRDEVPQDLVGTTFFLASRDADFISGQTINVDGGKTMH